MLERKHLIQQKNHWSIYEVKAEGFRIGGMEMPKQISLVFEKLPDAREYISNKWSNVTTDILEKANYIWLPTNIKEENRVEMGKVGGSYEVARCSYNYYLVIPHREIKKRLSESNKEIPEHRFATFESALRFCEGHKEYKKKERLKDKDKDTKFKLAVRKLPVNDVFDNKIEELQMVKAHSEGIISTKELHIFVYYRYATAFNLILDKLFAMLEKDGLYPIECEESRIRFFSKYIVNRDLVDRWVRNEIHYKGIDKLFKGLKQAGIIGVCGSGYIFKFQSEKEVMLKEYEKVILKCNRLVE